MPRRRTRDFSWSSPITPPGSVLSGPARSRPPGRELRRRCSSVVGWPSKSWRSFGLTFRWADTHEVASFSLNLSGSRLVGLGTRLNRLAVRHPVPAGGPARPRPRAHAGSLCARNRGHGGPRSARAVGEHRCRRLDSPRQLRADRLHRLRVVADPVPSPGCDRSAERGRTGRMAQARLQLWITVSEGSLTGCRT